jgi:hypothetical protein
VAALADCTTAWTGNDTRVPQIGIDELSDVDEPGGVLNDVLRDGVPLAGGETALRRARRAPSTTATSGVAGPGAWLVRRGR